MGDFKSTNTYQQLVSQTSSTNRQKSCNDRLLAIPKTVNNLKSVSNQSEDNESKINSHTNSIFNYKIASLKNRRSDKLITKFVGVDNNKLQNNLENEVGKHKSSKILNTVNTNNNYKSNITKTELKTKNNEVNSKNKRLEKSKQIKYLQNFIEEKIEKSFDDELTLRKRKKVQTNFKRKQEIELESNNDENSKRKNNLQLLCLKELSLERSSHFDADYSIFGASPSTSTKTTSLINKENYDEVINEIKDNVYKQNNFIKYKESEIIKQLNKKETFINYPKSAERCLTSFRNVDDSCSDYEIEKDQEMEILAMQQSFIKRVWDHALIFIILIFCIYEPLLMVFPSDSKFIKIFEIIVDILFIIDILVTIFNPYFYDGEFMVSKKKIIVGYLKTYFIFDLISCFPVSIFSFIGIQNINPMKGILKIGRLHKVLKWIRLLQLMRLGKNDSKGEILSALSLHKNSSINRIIKFSILLLLLLHISVCMWIYIGKFDPFNPQQTWIEHYNMTELDHTELYMASAYFILTTFFSVGYGDLTCNTISERIYIIMFMSIGTFFFSFGISSLSTLFSNQNKIHRVTRKKMKILNEIQREYKLPDNLNKKIKKSIKNDKAVNLEKFELLETLPKILRKEVIFNFCCQGMFKDVSFFKNKDREFVIYAMPMFSSMRLNKHDTLISYGEYIQEMYIVLTGKLSIRLNKYYNNLEISQIKENNHFGEVFMFLNQISPYLIDAKTHTSLISLKKEDFTKLNSAYNDIVKDIIKQSCLAMEKIQKRKQAVVELSKAGIELKDIKYKLRKLTSFLLNKNVDSYINEERNIEDAEDFILQNNIQHVVHFLNSKMRDVDFITHILRRKQNLFSDTIAQSSKSNILQYKNLSNPTKIYSRKLYSICEDEKEEEELGLDIKPNRSTSKARRKIFIKRIRRSLSNVQKKIKRTVKELKPKLRSQTFSLPPLTITDNLELLKDISKIILEKIENMNSTNNKNNSEEKPNKTSSKQIFFTEEEKRKINTFIKAESVKDINSVIQGDQIEISSPNLNSKTSTIYNIFNYGQNINQNFNLEKYSFGAKLEIVSQEHFELESKKPSTKENLGLKICRNCSFNYFKDVVNADKNFVFTKDIPKLNDKNDLSNTILINKNEPKLPKFYNLTKRNNSIVFNSPYQKRFSFILNNDNNRFEEVLKEKSNRQSLFNQVNNCLIMDQKIQSDKYYLKNIIKNYLQTSETSYPKKSKKELRRLDSIFKTIRFHNEK